MKNYLLFAYSCYYPSGGMNDCIGKFNTKDEAIDFFNLQKENLLLEQDADVFDKWENPLYNMDVANIYNAETEEKITLTLR